MQPADDVQFRDANLQGLSRFRDNFLDRQLKTVRVALLTRERAELARQDAVIGIIDVAIDDEAGAVVAGFFLPCKIRNRADGVQILRFKQPQRGDLGNALARDDFVVNVAKFAALNEKIHEAKIAARMNLEKKV